MRTLSSSAVHWSRQRDCRGSSAVVAMSRHECWWGYLTALHCFLGLVPAAFFGDFLALVGLWSSSMGGRNSEPSESRDDSRFGGMADGCRWLVTELLDWDCALSE